MTKYDKQITHTSSVLQKNTISLHSFNFNFYNTKVQENYLILICPI